MRHIKNVSTALFLGSMGAVLSQSITGCQSHQEQEQQNRYLIIEQQPNGKYVVVEEMPTQGPSRAIIREYDENGQMHERFMNEEEMRQLAQQEYNKMQTGESELNSAPSGEGMGLAGTILAVAAGSLLGNMIGNALMGNKNFQRHSNAVNRSAYHRSVTAAKKSGANSNKKSFFGNSNKKSSSSYRSFGG